MKFQIEINCDNAAFSPECRGEGSEVARILRDLADRIDREGLTRGDYFTLRDINGNSIGKASTTE